MTKDQRHTKCIGLCSPILFAYLRIFFDRYDVTSSFNEAYEKIDVYIQRYSSAEKSITTYDYEFNSIPFAV